MGFNGDPVLVSGTSASTAPWLSRAVSEGANMVRVNVLWQQVAPQHRPVGFVADDPGQPGLQLDCGGHGCPEPERPRA